MFPGRGCIIGGAASTQVDAYGDSDQPGNIPTATAADGIWMPNWASYHLNNGFHGLEWPTLPDPYFASVVVCWHANWKGTGQGNTRMLPPSRSPVDCDGFETVPQVAAGLGQYNRKGGLYSLKGNGRVIHNVSNNATLGSGAFTLEGWCYCTDNTVQSTIWDWRGTSTANVQPLIYLNGTAPNVGHLTYNRGGGGGDLIIDAAALTTNTWHHFALCRDSGTIYLYKDGVSVGNKADATNFTAANTIRIGMNTPGTFPWRGFLDEFRATPGVARYPGGTTFTVPAVPFPDY